MLFRSSRRVLLVFGAILLVAADMVLATAERPWQVFAGVIFWGLHMGATQGLLSTLVVDAAPADLRGTALGIYNLTTGVSLLVASVLAGWLWSAVSPAATFLAGGAVVAISLVGMLPWQPNTPQGAGPNSR